MRDALLTHDDDRLPQFTLDVAYSTVDPALFAAEEDPARYIGAKIRIGYKARHVEERLAELAFGLSSFDYLNIGYVRTDGTDIKIFDDEGRLHTFPKDEDGAIMLDAQLISAERVDAVRAWQAGHNKLLRTSREHPELHIDPMTMVWTDRQVNYMAAE